MASSTSMVLPGGPLEICFSFDTTISMTSYVEQVKARLQDMVQRLKSDIPGIKIALFAHGDYYQKAYYNVNPYVTRHIDFSDDVAQLCTFIKDSAPTNGGDWQECYELVVKEAREQLTWTPGTNKILVMIGDARAHGIEDYGIKFDGEPIDWKEEVKKLRESNIRCYGVYCKTAKSDSTNSKFFKSLSELGNGSFLELENFDSIFDFMMAICYREHGKDILFAYEAEVTGRVGGAVEDVHHMFTTLKKSASNASTECLKNGAHINQRKPETAAKKQTTSKTVNNTGIKGKKVPRSRLNKQIKSPQNESEVPSQSTRQKTKISKSEQKSKKPTTIDRVAQCKSKTAPFVRLRREKVPETNFALRYFPWSSWKLVTSSTFKDHLTARVERTGGKRKIVEYTTSSFFGGKTKCPALYEVAVRLPGCTKKVVYVKSCRGFTPHTDWKDVLFFSKSLRKQVDNVIRKQGGALLVRRLVLKKFRKYDDISSTLKNYDYVWSPAECAKKYRELKTKSYVISEEMDVE